MNSDPPDDAASEAELDHSLLKFERRSAPLLPRRLFILRVIRTVAIGFALLAAGLLTGMIGYRVTEHMSWIDAFANASMILSGMGPMAELRTDAGKIFAGCYALFSGLAFITVAGFVLSPFVHRLFHRFLLVDEANDEKNN